MSIQMQYQIILLLPTQKSHSILLDSNASFILNPCFSYSWPTVSSFLYVFFLWDIEWRCLACVWLFIVMSLFKRLLLFLSNSPAAFRCTAVLPEHLPRPARLHFVLTEAGEACGRLIETPKWLLFFFFTLRLCWGREIIGSGMETTAETVVLFLVRYIHRLLFSTRKKLLFRVKGFELNTFVKRIESKETLKSGMHPHPPTLG